jgi:hypothetical protein
MSTKTIWQTADVPFEARLHRAHEWSDPREQGAVMTAEQVDAALSAGVDSQEMHFSRYAEIEAARDGAMEE